MGRKGACLVALHEQEGQVGERIDRREENALNDVERAVNWARARPLDHLASSVEQYR